MEIILIVIACLFLAFAIIFVIIYCVCFRKREVKKTVIKSSDNLIVPVWHETSASERGERLPSIVLVRSPDRTLPNDLENRSKGPDSPAPFDATRELDQDKGGVKFMSLDESSETVKMGGDEGSEDTTLLRIADMKETS